MFKVAIFLTVPFISLFQNNLVGLGSLLLINPSMKTAILLSLLVSFNLSAQLSDPESKVLHELDERADAYFGVAKQIWNFAEVGYQEENSSALLQDLLAGEGFTVEAGVAAIPTAFTATFTTGQGPVIGILGEFDALPGITQTDSPKREERTDVRAGHACGHHLFGTGSAAAAPCASTAPRPRKGAPVRCTWCGPGSSTT